MKAAIYLRKSTDDNDKATGDKSVEQQRRSTLKFITQKGWAHEDEHVFVDDGISGGEWQKRPALLKLMEAARAGEFDVLVMRDFDRIGRDIVRNSVFIEELVECGVAIWLSDTGTQIKFETATEKTMVTVQSAGGEMLREQARKLSHGKAKDLWSQGRNSGGRVYGYDNVWVYPDGTRQLAPPGHNKPFPGIKTFWQINETEAAVVRALFRMYAAGNGLVVITKTINGDPKYQYLSQQHFAGKQPPSPTKGSGSWAPTGIREMLHNGRYTGRIPFGATRKIYRQGTKKRKLTGSVEYFDAPELRIVDELLWQAVQKRVKASLDRYVRDGNGHWWGAPERGSKYLLSGLLQCDCCGRAMVATYYNVGSPGKRRKVYAYECSNYSKRGPTVCKNSRRARMAEVEERVIVALEGQILRPEVVTAAIHRSVQLITEQRRRNPQRPAEIERELKKLRREVERFMVLVAEGNAPKAVGAEIRSRETQIEALVAEFERLEVPTISAELGPRRLERELAGRLAQFRDLLRANVPQARQVLKRLLAGPIRFEPLPEGFNLRGGSQLGALMGTSAEMASPRGFEPRSPP